MGFHGLHHVVLTVEDVPAAEEFYQELFDMDVLFREGTQNDTFGRVPDEVDWERAIAAGITPGMSFLRRDGIALALAEEEGDDSVSRLDHIAIAVDETDIDRIRDRAQHVGCET